MHIPKLHLSHRAAVLLCHDGFVFGGAFLATGILDGAHHLSAEALVAAGVVALKVTLRTVLPAPAQALAEQALNRAATVIEHHYHPGTAATSAPAATSVSTTAAP